MQQLRFNLTDAMEKYSFPINVFRILYLLIVVLFLFSGFLNVLNSSRFSEKFSTALAFATWYEFVDFIIDYILHSSFKLKEIIQNPHQRLSIIMGLISTYETKSYSLALCYMILYFRKIALSTYLITKNEKNIPKEFSNLMNNWSKEGKMTNFIATLETYAQLEFVFWKFVQPGDAEATLIMYEYYAVITAYCYKHSQLHIDEWKNINDKLRKFVASASKNNKNLLAYYDDLIRRVSSITLFIGNLG